MAAPIFHPLIDEWFSQRFGEPTEVQALGWPQIASGRNTLIAAPTGSGKTLAAFLVCIDRLLREWLEGGLEDEVQVVYVSPLKALSNDIQRNLETPLREIANVVTEAGLPTPQLRAAVRTGDTPASQRQSMLRRPPQILVTTPESLYLLVTSEKGRATLRSTKTVIVDEIHALARDKRGSHLSLTLERLSAICATPPVRIGLSATQKPIHEIAQFLVGSCTAVEFVRPDSSMNVPVENEPHLVTTPDTETELEVGEVSVLAANEPPRALRRDWSNRARSRCAIVDTGHVRDLQLAIDVTETELSAVCSHEQWTEVYRRLTDLIQRHRSTLIFVNTRRLAERVSHFLTELLGEDAVASHHGSLSRKLRWSAEQRLKSGELRAIVATASLEMGIDIGYIDLVCQIGSPRSIATFLQRVGRSGHSLGEVPHGRLFPLTRDELLESLALIRAVRAGDLDCIEIPRQPTDILMQQVIAEVACQDWSEEELYTLVRRAWPYRDLKRETFDRVLKMASDGVVGGSKRGAYLHRDRINGRLRARRSARLAAITSGGAIPEKGEYRVVTENDRTFVGTLDEDFAIESQAGDIFLLGNTSWRIKHVRGGEVVVNDAQGMPPTVPFWFGEAPGRTIELSQHVSRLRRDLAERVNDQESGDALTNWLTDECGADSWSASQAVDYVQTQQQALGVVPTQEQIVFERFFDESGGMQLVIHSPLGARINRAWGLAMRKRFCRSFDFELQAAADDNGIVLSLSPQHSFPIPQLFKMLRADNGRYLLEQAVLAAPMFQVRWRWNVTRALAVLRNQAGKKVPPYLQRFRSDDLLAAAFPETVGCLENHHGDVEIPNHPLVQQTMHDCLHEAMDVDRWLAMLEDVQQGKVELLPRDTREPSPFCYELLNANPYAFLDDAPLEERRSRAVATRRTLSREALDDLGRLDPEAVLQVRREAWPLVRSPDELHDALMSLVVARVDEADQWREWTPELVAEGRATQVTALGRDDAETRQFWVAAERLPLIEAIYEKCSCEPLLQLPAELQVTPEASSAWVELVRGRIQHVGPVTVSHLSNDLGLGVTQVQSALEALEGEGAVMRGRFVDNDDSSSETDLEQWCDRRLLARIHRLTLDGLRRQIRPVSKSDYWHFLSAWHHLIGEQRVGGVAALGEALDQLQGFEMPAGAWEKVFAARVQDYEPDWLDQLFASGHAIWGRLQPPKPSASRQQSLAALTRAVPITLARREDIAWLLPIDRSEEDSLISSKNGQVVEVLRSQGALFSQDLLARTSMLPAELSESLRELAGTGFVTSDSFQAVRDIVRERRTTSRRHASRKAQVSRRVASGGRWSCFPGPQVEVEAEQTIRAWCELLVRRYGVVFRELLSRESSAPPWYQMLNTFRRMEMRGEIRGGRFVEGVGGEQFASEKAVQTLRSFRDDKNNDDEWTVISAADPLNMIGILDESARLPANHANRFVLRRGKVVATLLAGQVEFADDDMSDDRRQIIRHSLLKGERRSDPPPLHIRGRLAARVANDSVNRKSL